MNRYVKSKKKPKRGRNSEKNQKFKNLKNPFLDTNSINSYAKLQVSRFNGMARMEVLHNRNISKFKNTYGFHSNIWITFCEKSLD